MNWRLILVPQDFSDGASRAQELAAELAERFQAQIVLLHGTPLPTGMSASSLIHAGDAPGAIPVDELATRAALVQLDRRAEALRARGLAVSTVALVGAIAETILEEARSRPVDVIVMGTHGRCGLAHWLLGSVAETVVRQALVPVVTVRDPVNRPVDSRQPPFRA